jgi:hypothetical protein
VVRPKRFLLAQDEGLQSVSKGEARKGVNRFGPQLRWRLVKLELIDKPRLQERAGCAGATFNHQAVDAARRHAFENGQKWAGDNFRAARCKLAGRAQRAMAQHKGFR